MAVKVIKDDEKTIVSYEGRLDSTTSGEMDETMSRLVEEGVRNIVVDFENTEYISSRGIRILVGTYRNLDGGTMEVINCNPSVREIFRLSGLTDILNVK